MASGQGRHGRHVSSACNGCRKRKAKCDGHPNMQCSTCAAHNVQCTWSAEEDGRKTVTREQAKSLRSCIAALREDNARQAEEIRVLRGQGPLPLRIPLSITIPEPQNGFPPGPAVYSHVTGGSLGPVHGSPNSAASIQSASSSSFPDSSSGSWSATSTNFLAVPSVGVFSRGSSPVSSIPTSISDNSLASSPSDSDFFVRLFTSNGRHALSRADGHDIAVLAGTSPGAFSYTMFHSHSSWSAAPQRPFPTASVPGTAPRFAEVTAMHGSQPNTSRIETGLYPTPTHDNIHSLDSWADYLPPSVQAHVHHSVHDRVLQAYFARNASCHLTVVPHLFRHDMRTATTATPFFSPSLHCALLAHAGPHADGTYLTTPEARDALAHRARELAEVESSGPADCSLPALQALLLVARYYLTRDGGDPRAFGALGTAMRATSKFGLNLSLVEHEWVRAWCYMSLYSQVVELALHSSCDVELAAPSLALLGMRAPDGIISADDWEVFVRSTSLAIILERIAELSTPSISEIFAVQESLSNWITDLPESLCRPTATAPARVFVLHMTYHGAVISLHRFFYTRDDSQSTKWIDDAGRRLFHLLQGFGTVYGFANAPFGLVQTTFMAGAAALVRLTTLAPGAHKPRKTVAEFAAQARDALLAMAPAWPCAASYAETLQRRISAGPGESPSTVWLPPSVLHIENVAGTSSLEEYPGASDWSNRPQPYNDAWMYSQLPVLEDWEQTHDKSMTLALNPTHFL